MSIETPKTYLELVGRAHDECGYTTDRRPATTKNQVNMAAKLIGMVADAHKEVQELEPDWRFNWAIVGGAMAANVDVIDPLVTWGVDVRTFLQHERAAYIYKPATGLISRMFLTYMPWDLFRGLNMPQIFTSNAIYWTMRPDRKLVYFPAPKDVGWTVQHECYLNPQILVADADEPRMPAPYRMSIVWAAVRKFAGQQQDGNLYRHAGRELDIILDGMRQTEQPQWIGGGSLA